MSYVLSAVREEVEKNHQAWLQQGREEERYEMAKNLLSEGFPLDIVKKVTKLPDLDLTELEKA